MGVYVCVCVLAFVSVCVCVCIGISSLCSLNTTQIQAVPVPLSTKMKGVFASLATLQLMTLYFSLSYGTVQRVALVDQAIGGNGVVNAVFRSARIVSEDDKFVEIEELRDRVLSTAKEQTVQLQFMKRWLRDDLRGIASYATDIMTGGSSFVQDLNSKNYSVVVLLHCNAGIDRTGEAVISYRMAKMSMSFEEAVSQTYADIELRPKLDKVRAAAWFCLDLQTERPSVVYNCDSFWKTYEAESSAIEQSIAVSPSDGLCEHIWILLGAVASALLLTIVLCVALRCTQTSKYPPYFQKLAVSDEENVLELRPVTFQGDAE